MNKPLTRDEIRSAKVQNPDKRDRDLADSLGISEAELLAADIGNGITRIDAHPDRVMPLLTALGEVMALTRNASCVHERVGTFLDYRSGPHASMVLGREIDTRIFPKYWTFGFAVEKPTPKGIRRSLQFFDAAGDAIQKVFLRDGSNLTAWEPLVTELRHADQSGDLAVAPREPVEDAKSNPEKREILMDEWARMTDTHQFNRIAAKLGMNRLGAYRLADDRWVRRVDPTCLLTFFTAVSAAKQKVVLFVGNRANIQIHWGEMDNIKVMGPWLNVLDPRFNLHLRDDHVAEVYVVEKPTKRGPAVSIEAFSDDGGLIFQCFGERDGEGDDLATWHDILAALPNAEVPA